MKRSRQPRTYPTTRLNIIIGLLVLIFIVITIRLFYLQVVRHQDFVRRADVSQIKSLEIEAERGRIYARNAQQTVPLVINERRWTMFSDTKFIDDSERLIVALNNLGITLTEKQRTALRSDSRYVVLRKRVTTAEKDRIESALTERGIYFQQQNIRQYLEGSLASQVLGFLNHDSQGQYGIEQYYDQILTGVPGRLRVTTDVHDVPLLHVEGNIFKEPQAGQDITLTLDVAMQRVIEDQLSIGVSNVSSPRASAVVLDADSGAVLAMANIPNFDPADFASSQFPTIRIRWLRTPTLQLQLSRFYQWP